jgi:hypothetical protein
VAFAAQLPQWLSGTQPNFLAAAANAAAAAREGVPHAGHSAAAMSGGLGFAGAAAPQPRHARTLHAAQRSCRAARAQRKPGDSVL